MNANVTIGRITLHLVADDTPYEEYPKVGIVARALLTVNAPPGGLAFAGSELCVLEVESGGVWDIECPDLVAGCPIPDGNWVRGDYGDDQIEEVQATIRALLPDNPIPTEKEGV